MRHVCRNILSGLKSEQSITLNRNFTHKFSSQPYFFATQYLELLLSVIKTVYEPEMRQFPRAGQNRLNTCKELTEMKHFGKNGRGCFVVGLMERHGIGAYPREGGMTARLQWLPQSALVEITREVVHRLLLDPYTQPDLAVSILGIRKLQ